MIILKKKFNLNFKIYCRYLFQVGKLNYAIIYIKKFWNKKIKMMIYQLCSILSNNIYKIFN